MNDVKQPWYAAWLTPIGLMVVLLVANLGLATWLSARAIEDRRRTDIQIEEHRVDNRKSHKELAEFILCIADHPDSPERDDCIDLVLAQGALR